MLLLGLLLTGLFFLLGACGPSDEKCRDAVATMEPDALYTEDFEDQTNAMEYFRANCHVVNGEFKAR